MHPLFLWGKKEKNGVILFSNQLEKEGITRLK